MAVSACLHHVGNCREECQRCLLRGHRRCLSCPSFEELTHPASGNADGELRVPLLVTSKSNRPGQTSGVFRQATARSAPVRSPPSPAASVVIVNASSFIDRPTGTDSLLPHPVTIGRSLALVAATKGNARSRSSCSASRRRVILRRGHSHGHRLGIDSGQHHDGELQPLDPMRRSAGCPHADGGRSPSNFWSIRYGADLIVSHPLNLLVVDRALVRSALDFSVNSLTFFCWARGNPLIHKLIAGCEGRFHRLRWRDRLVGFGCDRGLWDSAGKWLEEGQVVRHDR